MANRSGIVARFDGPAEITQDPIQPGDTFTYEFVTEQRGTYFYHTHDHIDRQQALGLYGALQDVVPGLSAVRVTSRFAVVFLVWDMMRRIRRARIRGELNEQLDAEEQLRDRDGGSSSPQA